MRKFAAEGFFVIRFDNRDVGLSTKFAMSNRTRAACERCRRDAAGRALHGRRHGRRRIAVLDRSGIEQTHVMGVSMGGMIVQQLAIDHPERLLSMTSVMSTTGDPDVRPEHARGAGLLLGEPPTDRAAADRSSPRRASARMAARIL